MKAACFTLSFAFCKPFRQARSTQQRNNGADESTNLRAPATAKTQKEGCDIVLTSFENRSEIDEKPSPIDQKINQKALLDGFGRQRPFRRRVGTRSGRARDAPKPAQEQSRDAPGTPRAAGRRPRASPGRSEDDLKRVQSDVGARTARQAPSDASSGRFFVVFVLTREAPMCCSYQFLQCFVGFERSKERTRTRSENARKSRRSGLQNRAWERPGDPKSSPGGPVRATKREKVTRSSAFFLEAGANGPDEATKGGVLGGQERPVPE